MPKDVPGMLTLFHVIHFSTKFGARCILHTSKAYCCFLWHALFPPLQKCSQFIGIEVYNTKKKRFQRRSAVLIRKVLTLLSTLSSLTFPKTFGKRMTYLCASRSFRFECYLNAFKQLIKSEYNMYSLTKTKVFFTVATI